MKILARKTEKICIVSQQRKVISFKEVISTKYHKAMLKRKRANKKIMLFNDWRDFLSQTISNTRILLFSRFKLNCHWLGLFHKEYWNKCVIRRKTTRSLLLKVSQGRKKTLQ